MVKLATYALLSSVATSVAVAHAHYRHPSFYSAAIYLTTHKISLVVLTNIAFAILLLLARTIKSLFLGSLSRDEVDDLVTNSKYAITETCLALTIFREELSITLVGLFITLLLTKIFHWLVSMRIEVIARIQYESITLNTHIRIQLLLLMLFAIDTFVSYSMIRYLMVTHNFGSTYLLFAFEYMILAITVVSLTVRYILHLVDIKLFQNQWSNRSTATFYLELVTDLVRLVMYIGFFGVICSYYGLPLHLIRELCVTFYSLRERIIKFITYKRLTANMNARFPNATEAELEATGDRTCIVCREEMTVGDAKKLPCNHIFHFVCLRTWLNNSSNCPTCRTAIPTTASAAAPAAGVQAAAAQPAADLPPLPPHLAAFWQPPQQQQPQQQQQQPTLAGLAQPQQASPLQPLSASTPTNVASSPTMSPYQPSLAELAAMFPLPSPTLQPLPSPFAHQMLPSLPLPPLPSPSDHHSANSHELLPVVTAATAVIQSQMNYLQQQQSALNDVFLQYLNYQQALLDYTSKQHEAAVGTTTIHTVTPQHDNDERKHDVTT